MNEDLNLGREFIKRIAGTFSSGGSLFIAQVTKVDGITCTIMLGELEISDVRIFSVEQQGNLTVKPLEGSMALVADLSSGKLRDLVILQADKVELIKYEENSLVIEIDSESKKLDIKNDQVGLKDLFQAVADIIKQLTVSTPAGPSGTPLPPTVQAVTQYETNFKKLLK